MDCHATAAAVSRNDSISNAYTSTNTTHNDSKATVTPSTAKKLTLCVSLALAATLELSACNYATGTWSPNYSQMVLTACYNFYGADLGAAYYSDNRVSLNNITNIRGSLTINIEARRLDDPSQHSWVNIILKQSGVLDSLSVNGGFKAELKSEESTHNMISITNNASRLNLRADDSAKLTVTTLNQTTANGDSQIFKNVEVTNFNLNSGKSYQWDGTITTLTIKGGEYRQGINDVGAVVPDSANNGNQNFGSGGTITTVDLQNGEFKQGKGTITTLTQSGGNATQTNGTITTLNLKGGTFTHNGGTLTTINLQDGNGVFNNNAESSNFTITQSGGDHTIGGKITNFTLKSGSLTNNGSIETLTSGSTTTTRQNRAATPTTTTTTANATQSTGFRNAQDTRATATRHITNNGTLDSLTLTEPTDVINVLNDDGTPKGIIKKLDVQSGESTINTLTGVAQNPDTGISSITIGKGSGGGSGSGGSGGSNGAKLTVDTLRVGLNGNTAIQRVTINNDDNSGNNKEFAAKTVQIAYLNGDFDPNTKISTTLKDYVTEKSQKYVDSSSSPVFTISPQARLSGVTGFQPDGTPIFDVEATLAAGMTSLVVRQSMRRKMLLDTYLAEQSRRSIKNKERRTKQRVEAVVLADAKKQYEKDLATYKQEKEKWDKLAATKENKALIAKYEQEATKPTKKP